MTPFHRAANGNVDHVTKRAPGWDDPGAQWRGGASTWGSPATTQTLTHTNPYLAADQGAKLLSAMSGILRFDTAVVLGSGWGQVSENLGTVRAEFPYEELPGFPFSSVPGHESVLRAMDIDGRRVLVFGGRCHLYEGHSVDTVVHPVRVAQSLGCSSIILTNAAGGINLDYEVGEPVLISDHLNLTGMSPMVGPVPPGNRPGRFCDLVDTYSQRLRDHARAVDPTLREGVYAGLLGGNYETPAEVRMLSGFGADLVGMSTVLEAIAARHLGMQVLGISMVTNPAAGQSPKAAKEEGTEQQSLDHADVLAQAKEAQPRVIELLRSVISTMP